MNHSPPCLLLLRHLPPRRGQRPMVRLVDPRSGQGPAVTLAHAAIYLQARGFTYQPGSDGTWSRDARRQPGS